MKLQLRYSILITLTLLISMTFIGLVNAYPNIGTTTQPNPFESRPTAAVGSTNAGGFAVPTIVGPANMRDGLLATIGTVAVAITAPNPTYTQAWYEFKTFQAHPGPDAVQWISIVVNYKSLLTDDVFRWQYTVGAASTTWTDLTADVVKFDGAATPLAQFRSFSQLADPSGGGWADLTALRVRVLITKAGAGWDGTGPKITITDIWASAYTSSPPPVASPTVSIQPPTVAEVTTAYEYMFIEVYYNNIASLAAGQITIYFNTTVLTPDSYWLYYPWTDTLLPTLNDAEGYVALDFSIPITIPVTPVPGGNYAMARIYFTIDEDPARPGEGLPPTPNFSWLMFSVSKVIDSSANYVVHAEYPGIYGTVPEGLSLLSGGTDLTAPESTEWTEIYPEHGRLWHLTSWDDNGDLILSVSDFITMTPTSGPPINFHVDSFYESDLGGGNVKHYIDVMGAVPEFPLGLGVLMAMAPLIAVIYLWRTRSKRRV